MLIIKPSRALSGVDEPLALTAPMVRRWAAQHCVRDAKGGTCENYHGFWPYLRLMGLGATLGGHPEVYVQVMADLARAWESEGTLAARRLLISGSADYSMLAHVCRAFERSVALLQVTVLDICPTPLKLNNWYAQRKGLAVELICADLLRYSDADHYDLIVTSSFLGYFSPEVRPLLFERYAQLLRPGGWLMFSNRLRPGSEAIQVGFSTPQKEYFAAKVAELSCQLPGDAALPAVEAYQMALVYADQRRPYPVNSVDTIRRLTTHAGLEWLDAWLVGSPPLQEGVSGPTLGDGSDFLFVVLRKQSIN